MKDETIAIHGGYTTDPTTHAVTAPIYQTVAYEFDDAQHGADLFDLAVPGNIYSRIMNPTCDVLEQRVAALEGGIGALAVSAGSAAINYAILNLASAGDNIVAVPQLYGGTYTLFAHMLPSQGIEVRFAADDSVAALEALIDERTKAVFLETIGNPAGNIVDLAAVAKMARSHGVATIADNTVASPALLKPIEHGIDIVVHSLTKYMGGHGTTLGGIIVDSGQFPWAEHAQRYPGMNTPEPSYHGVVYTEAFGPAAYIGRARTVPLRNTGAALSPFNAFQLLQGIETLNLRMERHCANTQAVAEYLQGHANVEWVSYAGLADHPHHALAQQYMGGKASGILTFGVKGGFDAGVKFYDALKLFKRLVNIGDAKSLACHPASTTHRQLTEDEQRAVGVAPEAIRLSVGIEHIDDILEDLNQALAT
ncbi:MAG TPA: bifunctional O-acetylhomoserine aminocarboxypropyltransferase/cysteine synthase [Gammaproteobacteria bacterium]|jgi:O-acetylhomoserine (thiol)-lyase|nr:O-acetylhomoserine aminocarboxypropyltransferase [Gammaproteobacteria bacterium]HBK12920.1 bifunctional O-acetylhomoserine aminocarboxypropyltransferase/cysteine synthase [Gammaproteobacteria bacterium]|tara:strand:+ start:611 stop:1879 length:1269 start_codon:yes stop_codon:yes gene_type:complete